MNYYGVKWENSPFHNILAHCYRDARFAYRLIFPVIQSFAQKPAIQKGFNYFKAFPILALLKFQWLHFYLSAIIGRKQCMRCATFLFSSKRKKGQQLQFPLSCSSPIWDSCSARQQNELSNIFFLHSVKSAILHTANCFSQCALHRACLVLFMYRHLQTYRFVSVKQVWNYLEEFSC